MYGEIRENKLAALRAKPNQKTYKVTYHYGPFEDEKTVRAATKADARKLAKVNDITKVELIA